MKFFSVTLFLVQGENNFCYDWQMDTNGLGFMNYETGGEFHVEDWAKNSFYLNAERLLRILLLPPD